MSPQLLWTIAGLILTVLTLGAVSISAFQSTDSATAKLVASEVGNVATASKLWAANKSTDGTYSAIADTAVVTFIPDLKISDTPGLGIESKVAPVHYTLAGGGTNNNSVVITATYTGSAANAQALELKKALSSRACAVAHTVDTAVVTYTCAG